VYHEKATIKEEGPKTAMKEARLIGFLYGHVSTILLWISVFPNASNSITPCSHSRSHSLTLSSKRLRAYRYVCASLSLAICLSLARLGRSSCLSNAPHQAVTETPPPTSSCMSSHSLTLSFFSILAHPGYLHMILHRLAPPS
jgi:hypothetical protein